MDVVTEEEGSRLRAPGLGSALGVIAAALLGSALLAGPARGDDGVELRARGIARPWRQVVLSARMSGAVRSLAAEGESVAEGAVVLAQDDELETAKLLEAEAGLSQAVADLGRVTATASADAAKAAALLGQARALEERAAMKRDEDARLAGQKLVSASQLRASELELEAARSNSLAAAAEGARVEAAAAAARIAAEASIARARAVVGLARAQLSRCRVTAPFAGRVLRRIAQPGQAIDVNEPALELISTERLWVSASFPIEGARRISPGARARVSFEGAKGPPREGRVILVGPLADAASGTIPVRVEVEAAHDPLAPGAAADVVISP